MSNRTVRINELLKREISQVLHSRFSTEAAMLTITSVEVAQDLHNAKVYFSVLRGGDDPEIARQWLRSTLPVVSRHLSKHVVLKFQPKLEFVHDENPDRAERILKLIDELNPGDPSA
jgi:ribosome-binding factor A